MSLAVFAASFVIASDPALASARSAHPCVLSWDASAASEISGYAVYYGIQDSGHTNRMDVANASTVALTNLTASVTYFFYVVAYNEQGMESEPSNTLIYHASALSPLKLQAGSDGAVCISFRAAAGTSCRVEFTDSLNPARWELLEEKVADSEGRVVIDDAALAPARFYRGVQP